MFFSKILFGLFSLFQNGYKENLEFIKTHNSKFNNYKILYGGSVKSNNAKDIVSLSNVDGALVGGASLKSDEFTKIIEY